VIGLGRTVPNFPTARSVALVAPFQATRKIELSITSHRNFTKLCSSRTITKVQGESRSGTKEEGRRYWAQNLQLSDAVPILRDEIPKCAPEEISS
jgi:hypothetical protein